jgi:2-succinyl-6-hydroxy-2,4-cyclohexadiene-1-carboxylate synthase
MIWCLHGFLGRGTDWDALRAGWPSDLPPLRTPDLFAHPPREESLAAFGARFAADVAAGDPTPVILGYSLGGRLALHALLARPDLWSAAIIVSAHLGLPEAADRAARLADDARWAARFQSAPWSAVLDDWNARPVFGGRAPALPRTPTAYDREALASALTAWSLGLQEPLADRLAALAVPILWIAGERDTRFVTQGERARDACAHVALIRAPGAAHRVPWEAPEWFAGEVAGFLRRHRIVSS